jgi:V8-like Glu-specific endopeptidase
MKCSRVFAVVSLALYASPSFAVVYGDDNRVEVSDVPALQERVRAVGMLLMGSVEHVDTYPTPKKSSSGLTFKTQTIPAKNDLRAFINQPRVGDCTGFLIAPDLMATAGHCIQSQSECKTTQVVFDYVKPNTAASSLKISKNSIYQCKKVITRNFKPSENHPSDYAVFQLDRPVLDRTPMVLADQKIETLDQMPLSILGFPRGVFMKYADHAKVLKIESEQSFRSNLDSFQCNSGSPIFEENTGKVVGILISGSFDDNAAMVNEKYSQVDVTYDEFPKEGSKQITMDPLLGEQGFFIGTVKQKLKEAGYAL